jgi:nucleoside-diphosphate-sugar epimerase|tara:strand:- start:176 stop:1126 length:951 start_codon:yes stop_codon:yes gene_type:complete
MSTYLVTGGAGFIGSHICEELVSRGDRVRVVDDLSTGRRENLDHLEGVELIIGDVADPKTADGAVAGVDYVVHLAAIPSVPRSIKDPLSSNHANVAGTVSVLVAAQRHGIKRLVFASSSAVYGDSALLPKHEDMPTQPLSPYALQKLTGEGYLRLFYDLHGLETVSVRYFNVFGPRQDPASAYSGVISLFARCLIENRPPTIYGDGEQTRDFTYVRNVVDGTLRACVSPDAAGRVMNVTCGGRVSLNVLFNTMRGMTASTVTPHYTNARVGDVRDSQGDITRAQALLQYVPTVLLEEGLEATMAWCRDQTFHTTSV